MKKFFVFSFILILVGQLGAQRVSQSQASQVCQRFLIEKNQLKASENFRLSEVYTQDNGETALYRFQLPEVGFVVVSASMTTPPVLAYAFDQNFEMIPPVSEMFRLYKLEIATAEKSQWPAKPEAAAAWNRYLADEFTPKKDRGTEVGPLLTSTWNQNKFYNTYCPWDAASGEYYDNRVPNGCVALACSQIINYHRYPDHGIGATTYIPQGYPRQTVYFAQHTYHYDAMCNHPTSYANEIAKLCYHMGVAIQMMYTPDGSGAYTEQAMNKLKSVFNYDASIALYTRNNYLDTNVTEFISLLKYEMNCHRPVLYSGHPQYQGSGHAYVLDGYDNEDRFHINYGWGGSSNAYYAIDNFVSGPTHWDYDGKAVVRIFPSGAVAPNYCQGHQRNTASFGYVADGSPTAKPYQSNPDCSWMVAVPHAQSYNFSFDRLDLNEGDYVTIYNGPTEESGVLVTLTGSEVPSQEFQSVADSVLITFVGNTNNTDHYGFLISYSTTLPQRTCEYTTNLNNVWNAVITDGSQDGEKYIPESSCKWNIKHNFISGYAFTFPVFNLGYGDFVDVYDISTGSPVLYKRFDIYDKPEGIYNVNFQKMQVHFVSDNWDEGEGFRMEYYAIAAVEDYNGLDDLNVYPNPATNYVNIDFSLAEAKKITMKLMDMTGKVLKQDAVEGIEGANQQRMDIEGVSKGLYLLEISTQNGKSVRKIAVQ